MILRRIDKQQPKIFECLKILALKKIIDENNIKKINLFYANSDIVNSIKDICSNKEIYLKSFKQKNKSIWKIKTGSFACWW